MRHGSHMHEKRTIANFKTIGDDRKNSLSKSYRKNDAVKMKQID